MVKRTKFQGYEKPSPYTQVLHCFIDGVKVPGVYSANGRVILGSVQDKKFIVRPYHMFYRPSIWVRIQYARTVSYLRKAKRFFTNAK